MAIAIIPAQPAPAVAGLAVAQGLDPILASVHQAGVNRDTSMAEVAVWESNGDYTGHNATAAEIVEVFSDVAGDAGAGTGAQTVEVTGLDGSYEPVSEIVTLAGLTPANTLNSYLRLNRMVVRSSGSSDVNEGLLTARQSVTPANVFATVAPGSGRSLIACYTIPNNTVGFLLSLFGQATGAVEMKLRQRPLGEAWTVQEVALLAEAGGHHRDFRIPRGPIAPRSDLEVRAVATLPNRIVSAGFALLTVRIP